MLREIVPEENLVLGGGLLRRGVRWRGARTQAELQAVLADAALGRRLIGPAVSGSLEIRPVRAESRGAAVRGRPEELCPVTAVAVTLKAELTDSAAFARLLPCLEGKQRLTRLCWCGETGCGACLIELGRAEVTALTLRRTAAGAGSVAASFRADAENGFRVLCFEA